jgi:hypothetical protein
MLISAEFFLELEVFQTKVAEKIKAQILRQATFFPPRKSRHVRDNVEKFGTAREATEDNIIRCMLFMLDN